MGQKLLNSWKSDTAHQHISWMSAWYLLVSPFQDFAIFTAWRYARAVYAVIVCVCLSVCPSVRHKSEFYQEG